MVFKLQEVKLSVNNFWSFIQIWKEVLSKNSNLKKHLFWSIFRTITLGVYNLLRNDLIHESIKLGW